MVNLAIPEGCPEPCDQVEQDQMLGLPKELKSLALLILCFVEKVPQVGIDEGFFGQVGGDLALKVGGGTRMEGSSEEVEREELVHVGKLARQAWLRGEKGGEST